MKKLFTILIFNLCFSYNVNSQILERIHTFDGQVTINMEKTCGDEIPDADCYYGSEFNSYNNSVTFYVYNADFTQRFYKKVTIPERSGEKIYSVIATQRILNDDDNYEFFVVTTYDKAITTSPVNFNQYMRCIIYDEDGNKIQDLGTAYNWMLNPTLHFTQGECRMSLMYYTMNSDNTMRMNTVIYRVNGKNNDSSNVREISSDESVSYLRWNTPETIDLAGRRAGKSYSGIRIINGKKYIK